LYQRYPITDGDEPPIRLRSAYRYHAEPERQHTNIGVRITRSAP
jgi:hypothetical protein